MMKLNINDIKKYKNLELLAKQLVEGFITGLHKSPYHGFSVEFSEHKQYNTGESTKNIDWKVFARTDKLYIKQYEEETNLRAHLVIDSSSSMYYPKENNGKINFSILCAAALATILQKQRDAISLINFSDQIDYQSPTKSTTSHIHQQLMYLENLLDNGKLEKKTATAQVIHEIAQKISKRGLVVLFTDMFENVDEMEKTFLALQHLKHQKHEVMVFHVLDNKTEVDFEFSNKPHIFVDAETGEKVKLRPSEIKETYKTQMGNFLKEVEIKCHQLKIDYIPVDINEDFEKVMLSFFIKRKKMK